MLLKIFLSIFKNQNLDKVYLKIDSQAFLPLCFFQRVDNIQIWSFNYFSCNLVKSDFFYNGTHPGFMTKIARWNQPFFQSDARGRVKYDFVNRTGKLKPKP